MKNLKTVPIGQIIIKDENKPRFGEINTEVVEAYRETYLHNPDRLPPISVIEVEDPDQYPRYEILDGVHRALGAKQAGVKSIAIDILPKMNDAEQLIFGIRANLSHGLSLNKGQKIKHAIALRDVMSHREMANLFGVTHGTIGNWLRKSAEHSKEDSKQLSFDLDDKSTGSKQGKDENRIAERSGETVSDKPDERILIVADTFLEGPFNQDESLNGDLALVLRGPQKILERLRSKIHKVIGGSR